MEEVIAPGPARRGVEIGTITSEDSFSTCLDFGMLPKRKSNDNKSKRMPPAIRKAVLEIPRPVSMDVPKTENTSKRARTASEARREAFLISFLPLLPQIAMNAGTAPNGSIIANRDASTIKNSARAI